MKYRRRFSAALLAFALSLESITGLSLHADEDFAAYNADDEFAVYDADEDSVFFDEDDEYFGAGEDETDPDILYDVRTEDYTEEEVPEDVFYEGDDTAVFEEMTDEMLPEEQPAAYDAAEAEDAAAAAVSVAEEVEDPLLSAVVDPVLPQRVHIEGLWTGSLEAGNDGEGMPTFVGDEMMLTTEAEKDWIEAAAYEEAMVLMEAEELQKESDEDIITDYLVEHLVGDSSAGLPSSYRNTNLTPVMNQGSVNACWAYATLDAGLIRLLGRGIGDGSFLFSPMHLQYSAFHGTGESWGTTGASWYSVGGTPNVAGSTLLRWYGAASASDYPSAGSSPGESYALTEDEMKSSLSHVTSVIRLAEPNGSSSATQPIAARMAAVSGIKQAVWDGNAVTIDFYNRGYNASTNSVYNTGDTINHEAVIVGWDDNKITGAGYSMPGAFLLKNTYGTSYGENGFFWLSYYDCSMTRPYIFVFEDTVSGEHEYTKQYSYDPTGYRNWILSGGSATPYANVFTAQDYESIGAAGIYLPAGASYTVTLVTGITDGTPNTGKTAATVSGSVSSLGFYTVRFPSPVRVRKGEQFAIVAKSIADGTGYCFFEGAPYTYTNGLTKNTVYGKGETYISLKGGSFTDILDSTIVATKTDAAGNKTSVSTPGSGYGNACIKAYANDAPEYRILDGVDYSAVYDFNYFIESDKSYKAKYENDPAGALKYFTTTGMKNLLKGIETFDPVSYLREYPELRRKYGTDWKEYYLDYMREGMSAGRHGTGCTKMKAPVTTYRNRDYSAVYSFDYYTAHYSDIANKYKYDDAGALEYFVKTGMGKKHQAIASFNVISYLYEYAALRRKYGTSWSKYYLDYIDSGKAAGRHGTGCTKMKNPITVYGGLDYKAVYDFAYYTEHYTYVRVNYRYDDYGALKYFVTTGTKKMQRASSEFSVKSYVYEYRSLRKLYGTNWLKYYQSYIRYGKKKGRHGTGCTKMKNPVTVYNGKDYSKEYDFFYYINHYPTIKKRFQYDDYGALKYYVTVSRKKHRKAKA